MSSCGHRLACMVTRTNKNEFRKIIDVLKNKEGRTLELDSHLGQAIILVLILKCWAYIYLEKDPISAHTVFMFMIGKLHNMYYLLYFNY